MGGIAGTLDANYFKGQGERQGTEREFVVMVEAMFIDTTHCDDVVRTSDIVSTIQNRDMKGGEVRND